METVMPEVAYLVRYRAGHPAWLRDLLYAVAAQVQPVDASILVEGDAIPGQAEVEEMVQRMGDLVEARIAGDQNPAEALASIRAPYCSVLCEVDIPYPRQAAVLSAALRGEPAAGGVRGTGYLVQGQVRNGAYVALEKSRWVGPRSEGTLVLGALMFRIETLREAAWSGSPGDGWENVLRGLASTPGFAILADRVAERRLPPGEQG
jgi:hypothetical protein